MKRLWNLSYVGKLPTAPVVQRVLDEARTLEGRGVELRFRNVLLRQAEGGVGPASVRLSFEAGRRRLLVTRTCAESTDGAVVRLVEGAFGAARRMLDDYRGGPQPGWEQAA